MTKTFVLMHGAWHGGWCWAQVADALRARGHRVTTPTQTGLGERQHLLSDQITLQTFIDDLVNHILAEDLTDAIVVGHSFGGNALSGSAEAIPERLKELVYLDCTVLAAGERPVDLIQIDDIEGRIQRAKEDGDGIGMPPPGVETFGVMDAVQAAWLQPRLTPHPISTMLSPLPITGIPGNGLPARYIACTEPVYHNPDRVWDWADRSGWAVEELRTGHDAMVTDPPALVEMLDR
ncbi:MAG: alpha/beta hydrolase family protein [Pseudomonadota bacterium]